MQILRAPFFLFLVLSTALSFSAVSAQASMRSVELTEFILWAADLGWAGLPEDAVAARRLWLEDRRTVVSQTAALARHAQRLKYLQSEQRSLQATLEFSGGQRQRSQMRIDIVRISREIEALETLTASILRSNSQIEERSPLNYPLPDSWIRTESAALRIGASTPGKTRAAQVEILGQQVATELAELSLKSELPWESWLEQRSMRARNVLLLTIAALQLSQEAAPSSVSQQVFRHLSHYSEPMFFWGGGLGAVSGVLLGAGTGDWSHLWVSVPLGAVAGTVPGLILTTLREVSVDAGRITSPLVDLQTSRFLLKRFLRRAGFKSLLALQQEFEMRFRHSDLGGCIEALSP